MGIWFSWAVWRDRRRIEWAQNQPAPQPWRDFLSENANLMGIWRKVAESSLLFDAGSLTIGQFRLRHIRLSAVFSRNPFSLAMRTVIPLLSPLRHQIHAINVSWMTLGPSFWSQLLPFPLVKHFRLYLCCCFPPTYSSSPLMENIYENNIHNNTTPTNARGMAIYIFGAVVHAHNPRLQHSQPR